MVPARRWVPMSKTYRSDALAAIHETASDLYDAGVMDKRTLREFDELCLSCSPPASPRNSCSRPGRRADAAFH
jgi:hypothetical protein